MVSNNEKMPFSNKEQNKTNKDCFETMLIATFTFALIAFNPLLISTSVFGQSSGPENINAPTSPVTQVEFPLSLSGTIFHYTNNNTQPPGTFIIAGTWSLKIYNKNNATFTSDVTMARTGDAVAYTQRFEHSHHITNFRTSSISINPTRIVVNGTADNIMNGFLRWKDIPVSIVITGGNALPYSQISVIQGGEATKNTNGATPWYGHSRSDITVEFGQIISRFCIS
jgi:hypothetical protein